MDEFKESRCVLAASATVLAIVLSRRQRRRKNKAKRLWTRPWIQMRQQHGAYHCLLKELRMSDKPSYRNFLRMDEGAFEELSHAIILVDLFFLRSKTLPDPSQRRPPFCPSRAGHMTSGRSHDQSDVVRMLENRFSSVHT